MQGTTQEKTVGQMLVEEAKQPMAKLDLSTKREAKRHNGHTCIIECCWDCSHMRWMFMRVRGDKSFPNSFTTAQGECVSFISRLLLCSECVSK